LWHADQQRHSSFQFEVGGLAPATGFGKGIAVVAKEDHDGAIGQLLMFKSIQQTSHLCVDVAHAGIVSVSQFGHLFRGDRFVFRNGAIPGQLMMISKGNFRSTRGARTGWPYRRSKVAAAVLVPPKLRSVERQVRLEETNGKKEWRGLPAKLFKCLRSEVGETSVSVGRVRDVRRLERVPLGVCRSG
jgi:hypothetical protein